MTINLKVLGQNSYELVPAAGDNVQDHLAALDSAVTGILDGGTYTSSSYKVSDLNSGDLNDFYHLLSVVEEGTGTAVTYLGKVAHKFNKSKILVPIAFGVSSWTFEFDYARTSNTDWPVAASEGINSVTGLPYFTLTPSGEVRISVGSTTVAVKWGTVPVSSYVKYAVVYHGGKLHTYINGTLQGVTETALAVWGTRSTNMVLSDLDAVVTSTNWGWYNARTDKALPAGKTYWEIELLSTSSNGMIGVANSGMSLEGNFSDANAIGIYLGAASWYGSVSGSSAVSLNTAVSNVTGTIYMFAYDYALRCIFLGMNGVWFNGATPSVSGSTSGAVITNISQVPLYPAVSLVGIAVRLKSDSQALRYEPPTSYSAYGQNNQNPVPAPALPLSLSSIGLGKAPGVVLKNAAASWDGTATEGVSFSSDLKTVQIITPWRSVRGAGAVSSGKVYWEIRLNAYSSNSMLGICGISHPMSSHFSNTALGYYLGSGALFGALGGAVGTSGALSPVREAGTVYMFALDMNTGRLFMGINGVWSYGGVPSSGTSTGAMITNLVGSFYPAAALYSGDNLTLRSMSTEISYPVPSGYSPIYESSIEPPFYSSGYLRNIRATSVSRYSGLNYSTDSRDFAAYSEQDASLGKVVALSYAVDAVGNPLRLRKSVVLETPIYNLDSGNFELDYLNWELYDAQAGSGARCYRAATLGGGYKYVVLDITSAPAGELYLKAKVYEAWNAVTHVGLNLAYLSADVGSTVRAGPGESIGVFASARWLALVGPTTATSNADALVGCFEIEKGDEAEPDNTYPRFAWLSQYGLSGYMIPPQAWNTFASLQYYCFSLPRTVGGLTAELASRFQMTGTLANRVTAGSQTNSYYCNSGPTNYGGGYYTGDYYISVTLSQFVRRLEQVLPTGTNPWNTGSNNYVFSPYAVDMSIAGSHVRGRFYGLKLLANSVGQTGDMIAIRTDGKGLYSQTGVAINHYVVRLPTGGCAAIPLSL